MLEIVFLNNFEKFCCVAVAILMKRWIERGMINFVKIYGRRDREGYV